VADVPRWLLVILLLVEMHFGASYLVPLRTEDQGLFGGLLKWVWPWGVGNRGYLGEITDAGFPMVGFYLAMGAVLAFLLAVLGALGWLVPQAWWRALTVVGVVLSLVLVSGFLGVTKALPVVLGVLLLWVVFTPESMG
jgi:hypothetical protein